MAEALLPSSAEHEEIDRVVGAVLAPGSEIRVTQDLSGKPTR